MSVQVTDSQVHVWRNGTPPPPRPPEEPFGHTQLIPLMDQAGVKRAVVIPPSWSADGNSVAIAAAEANPDRLAIMGVLPIHQLDKAESNRRIATWRSQPGMLGIRLAFHSQPYRAWLRDGSMEWFWSAVEKAELPVMMTVTGQLEPVYELAREHPGLRIILDHLGMHPSTRGDDAARELALLLRLSPFANVGVKASTLPRKSIEPYPFVDVHDYVRRAIQAFGPHRVFWGSNLTQITCGYEQAVAMMDDVLRDLDTTDKQLVMGKALGSWLGWPE